MSDTSGGTALKYLSIAGNFSGSAGSAGISITFFKPQAPLSRCHSQTDADKSFSGTALKSLSIAGNFSGSAGSAGISINFLKPQAPLSRCHSQTDADKSFSE